MWLEERNSILYPALFPNWVMRGFLIRVDPTDRKEEKAHRDKVAFAVKGAQAEKKVSVCFLT